jgi:MFS transporter, SP family, solute carrier family 2 (myo-inositol transporter), member 13
MADEADEPLIGNGEESYTSNLSTDPTLLHDSLQSPGLFVWLLTFSAGISGLLFGCE